MGLYVHVLILPSRDSVVYSHVIVEKTEAQEGQKDVPKPHGLSAVSGG